MYTFLFFAESLHALEDTDLDALMADLVADISQVEKTTLQTSQSQEVAFTQPPTSTTVTYEYQLDVPNTTVACFEDNLPAPSIDLALDFPLPPPPPPPSPPPEPHTQVSRQKTTSQKKSEAPAP